MEALASGAAPDLPALTFQAADLAVRRGVPVRRVPVGELQRLLVERVVEALESLQSAILEPREERAVAGN